MMRKKKHVEDAKLLYESHLRIFLRVVLTCALKSLKSK